jgi:biotin carboxyl carrier protein
LGYYGEPVGPIDPKVMDKVMDLPRTEQFKNWKPEGYDKSIEEIRREIGPDLPDDDLLLKILIPGKPGKSAKPRKRPPLPAVKPTPTPGPPAEFPSEFIVDVDGDVFNVKLSPVLDSAVKAEETAETGGSEKTAGPGDIPPGAVLCGMPGLVLSIDAKVGDTVNEGDSVAIIEAMKMRRSIEAPHGGEVKEIRAREGEMVETEDILMVVQK